MAESAETRLARIEAKLDHILMGLPARVSRLERVVAWIFGLGSGLSLVTLIISVYALVK